MENLANDRRRVKSTTRSKWDFLKKYFGYETERAWSNLQKQSFFWTCSPPTRPTGEKHPSPSKNERKSDSFVHGINLRHDFSSILLIATLIALRAVLVSVSLKFLTGVVFLNLKKSRIISVWISETLNLEIKGAIWTFWKAHSHSLYR